MARIESQRRSGQGTDLIARYDMVTRLHTGDTLSHTLDNTCCLMAQDAWEEAFRVCNQNLIQQGVMQPLVLSILSFK